jgi:hypothetical protein
VSSSTIFYPGHSPQRCLQHLKQVAAEADGPRVVLFTEVTERPAERNSPAAGPV